MSVLPPHRDVEEITRVMQIGTSIGKSEFSEFTDLINTQGLVLKTNKLLDTRIDEVIQEMANKKCNMLVINGTFYHYRIYNTDIDCFLRYVPNSNKDIGICFLDYCNINEKNLNRVLVLV
jgi:hypothetical protein